MASFRTVFLLANLELIVFPKKSITLGILEIFKVLT